MLFGKKHLDIFPVPKITVKSNQNKLVPFSDEMMKGIVKVQSEAWSPSANFLFFLRRSIVALKKRVIAKKLHEFNEYVELPCSS